MPRLFSSTSLAVSALTAALCAGCGSSHTTGQSSVLQVAQRLSGTWKVQSFTPEAALEPPLQGLLNAELGQLSVTFTGNAYSAKGPALDVNGRFELQSGAGDILSGLIYDPTGVAYRVSGQFEGALLHFHSYDSPWTGSGLLVRP